MTCPLKIPARLAAEVMAAVPRVHLNAKFIPLHIALLIIHAREDSIVEPQVSFLGNSTTSSNSSSNGSSNTAAAIPAKVAARAVALAAAATAGS